MDPGFPRQGGTILGEKLIIDKIFPKNCMKIEEIGPREEALVLPWDLALGMLNTVACIWTEKLYL